MYQIFIIFKLGYDSDRELVPCGNEWNKTQKCDLLC